ncbi:MAG TPA: hypothetical protein VK838_07095, partial [Candidatus Limnocylindrales bacterium]|nr:hypothetical protein [Candidatus Limnocylindrales bacterium]
ASPRIEAAVRANLADLPVNVTPEAVREALHTPGRARKATRRRPLLLAGGVAAAGLLAVVAAAMPASESDSQAAVQQTTPAASPVEPRSRSSGQVTLADCGIGPPDATLAFSGWITPRRLGLSTADLQAGRPVLALVPEDVVAWNPPGGPRIMPPVRGRMACLSDAIAGTLVVVGLPSGWAPPTLPRFRGGPIEGPDGGPRSSETG